MTELLPEDAGELRECQQGADPMNCSELALSPEGLRDLSRRERAQNQTGPHAVLASLEIVMKGEAGSDPVLPASENQPPTGEEQRSSLLARIVTGIATRYPDCRDELVAALRAGVASGSDVPTMQALRTFFQRNPQEYESVRLDLRNAIRGDSSQESGEAMTILIHASPREQFRLTDSLLAQENPALTLQSLQGLGASVFFSRLQQPGFGQPEGGTDNPRQRRAALRGFVQRMFAAAREENPDVANRDAARTIIRLYCEHVGRGPIEVMRNNGLFQGGLFRFPPGWIREHFPRGWQQERLTVEERPGDEAGQAERQRLAALLGSQDASPGESPPEESVVAGEPGGTGAQGTMGPEMIAVLARRALGGDRHGADALSDLAAQAMEEPDGGDLLGNLVQRFRERFPGEQAALERALLDSLIRQNDRPILDCLYTLSSRNPGVMAEQGTLYDMFEGLGSGSREERRAAMDVLLNVVPPAHFFQIYPHVLDNLPLAHESIRVTGGQGFVRCVQLLNQENRTEFLERLFAAASSENTDIAARDAARAMIGLYCDSSPRTPAEVLSQNGLLASGERPSGYMILSVERQLSSHPDWFSQHLVDRGQEGAPGLPTDSGSQGRRLALLVRVQHQTEGEAAGEEVPAPESGATRTGDPESAALPRLLALAGVPERERREIARQALSHFSAEQVNAILEQAIIFNGLTPDLRGEIFGDQEVPERIDLRQLCRELSSGSLRDEGCTNRFILRCIEHPLQEVVGRNREVAVRECSRFGELEQQARHAYERCLTQLEAHTQNGPGVLQDVMDVCASPGSSAGNRWQLEQSNLVHQLGEWVFAAAERSRQLSGSQTRRDSLTLAQDLAAYSQMRAEGRDREADLMALSVLERHGLQRIRRSCPQLSEELSPDSGGESTILRRLRDQHLATRTTLPRFSAEPSNWSAEALEMLSGLDGYGVESAAVRSQALRGLELDEVFAGAGIVALSGGQQLAELQRLICARDGGVANPTYVARMRELAGGLDEILNHPQNGMTAERTAQTRALISQIESALERVSPADTQTRSALESRRAMLQQIVDTFGHGSQHRQNIESLIEQVRSRGNDPDSYARWWRDNGPRVMASVAAGVAVMVTAGSACPFLVASFLTATASFTAGQVTAETLYLFNHHVADTGVGGWNDRSLVGAYAENQYERVQRLMNGSATSDDTLQSAVSEYWNEVLVPSATDVAWQTAAMYGIGRAAQLLRGRMNSLIQRFPRVMGGAAANRLATACTRALRSAANPAQRSAVERFFREFAQELSEEGGEELAADAVEQLLRQQGTVAQLLGSVLVATATADGFNAADIRRTSQGVAIPGSGIEHTVAQLRDAGATVTQEGMRWRVQFAGDQQPVYLSTVEATAGAGSDSGTGSVQPLEPTAVPDSEAESSRDRDTTAENDSTAAGESSLGRMPAPETDASLAVLFSGIIGGPEAFRGVIERCWQEFAGTDEYRAMISSIQQLESLNLTEEQRGAVRDEVAGLMVSSGNTSGSANSQFASISENIAIGMRQLNDRFETVFREIGLSTTRPVIRFDPSARNAHYRCQADEFVFGMAICGPDSSRIPTHELTHRVQFDLMVRASLERLRATGSRPVLEALAEVDRVVGGLSSLSTAEQDYVIGRYNGIMGAGPQIAASNQQLEPFVDSVCSTLAALRVALVDEEAAIPNVPATRGSDPERDFRYDLMRQCNPRLFLESLQSNPLNDSQRQLASDLMVAVAIFRSSVSNYINAVTTQLNVAIADWINASSHECEGTPAHAARVAQMRAELTTLSQWLDERSRGLVPSVQLAPWFFSLNTIDAVSARYLRKMIEGTPTTSTILEDGTAGTRTPGYRQALDQGITQLRALVESMDQAQRVNLANLYFTNLIERQAYRMSHGDRPIFSDDAVTNTWLFPSVLPNMAPARTVVQPSSLAWLLGWIWAGR